MGVCKILPKLGEPTLEVRAEDKLVYTMPYEEEEDRVCKVKCPKGRGDCGNGSTSILLQLFLSNVMVPKRSNTLCPKSNGACWLCTTDASTFRNMALPI